MRVSLVLAEAGLLHQDGTFSLIRGGLTSLRRTVLPLHVRAVLAVLIEGDPAETGSHAIRAVIIDDDGRTVTPGWRAVLEVLPGGGRANLLWELEFACPREGRYSIRVTVDNLLHADWGFVVETPRPSAGDGFGSRMESHDG